MERLKNELASERSEENAEREYNYDARKRIYNECLPHLFRFIRKAQAWPAKFDAIVKHAKDGDIVRIDRDGKSQPVRLGDLKANNYFKVHTLYLLFAPIAAVKIFEEKLTTLDLNLDKNVAIQYKLGKALFYSFSTDNHFAGTYNMKLHYREHKINKYNRLDDGDRQVLRGYEIDVITPFFIRSVENEPRLKTFIEFKKEYEEEICKKIEFNKKYNMYVARQENEAFDTNKPLKEFAALNTIFHNFEPNNWESKPILWRILLYYTMLCDSIKLISEQRYKEKGTGSYFSDAEFKQNLDEVFMKVEERRKKYMLNSTETHSPPQEEEWAMEDALTKLKELSSAPEQQK